MRGEMFDLKLGAFARGQVADREHFAASPAILDGVRRHLDDQLFAIGTADRGLGGAIARRCEARTIGCTEPPRGIASNEVIRLNPQQDSQLPVGFENAAAAQNGEAFERRVGKAAQVGQQPVEEGAAKHQPDQAERRADDRDDQPAMPLHRGRIEARRIGREHRRRHRGKMERDHADDGEQRREGDARVPAQATKDKEGQRKASREDGKSRDDRGRLVADDDRCDDRRHAGEMHRGHAERGDRARHEAGSNGKVATGGEEARPKGENGNGHRQGSEARVETQRHRAVISEHRDEVRCPDTNPRRERCDSKPLAPPRFNAIGRAFQKQKERGAS